MSVFCYFCGSGSSLFSLLLVVDVCWMVRLHSAALVGCFLYAGQRGLELVGLLHLLLFAFIK